MDSKLIDDLKQFIAAIIAQQTDELREALRNDLRKELAGQLNEVEQRLTKKIDDLSASVGDALENSNEATATQLTDHEHRLTRLEAKTA